MKDNKKLTKVMNEKTFTEFLDYAVLVARQGCKELKEGYIAPSPYDDKCKYCKYGGMCGFNKEVAEPRKESAITPTAIAEIVQKAKNGKEEE